VSTRIGGATHLKVGGLIKKDEPWRLALAGSAEGGSNRVLRFQTGKKLEQ
jgi:hypothetical protein